MAKLLLIIAAVTILQFSTSDFIVSLKPARSFDDLISGEVSAGVHIKGEVPLLLDYFAVCVQYRSHGYGSQCLAQMKTMWSGISGILAEVEDPDKSSSEDERNTRARRVAFYQRNGLRPTKVYSVLFGVPYVLHYFPLNADCSDEQLLQELDAIYHTLFPQPVYAANAHIWLTESEAQ